MAEESAGEGEVAPLAGSSDDTAGTDTESSSADEREGVDLIAKELTSALPWKQVIPLCLLQVSETFNSSGIFAYSAFLVSDFTGVSVDQAGFAAGFLQAASFFGMFLSSFGWGVASDRLGKRPCLLLGTTGSLLSCLAFGFSVNLPMAVAVRFANGCLNGNLGIAKLAPFVVLLSVFALTLFLLCRSYLGAITHEKNQARAFSLIAICWGAGALVGAAIGGFLARPAVQYPTVFDAKGLFGTFPYLLPNLVTAVFNLAGLIGGFLFLAEPKVERTVAADGSSHPPVWRQRKAMLATLAYVFLGFVFVLYEEAMPLFLAATNGGMGMMTAQIGLFESILGSVFLVTTFFYRYIPERIGLLKTHRLGLLMSVPLMVVTPMTAWVVKQPVPVVWTVMVVLCVAWGITGMFWIFSLFFLSLIRLQTTCRLRQLWF
jgi:MFS family permease